MVHDRELLIVTAFFLGIIITINITKLTPGVDVIHKDTVWDHVLLT
jgi:hypothetical protein